MKTLIVGASGLVGSHCLHYLKNKNWHCLGTHYSQQTDETTFFDTLNIADERNERVLKFQPEVVIHCGALTHVDYCETHEKESWEKTVKSTVNLIEYVKQKNAIMIYISTDYVFDGKAGPYTEMAKPNPINVYGKHKLEAEHLIRKELKSCLIIRVSKVFGEEEREKNFVARILKSLQGGELKWKAFTDQFNTSVYAGDIAKAIYLLIRESEMGVYHLSNNKYAHVLKTVNQIASYFPHAKTQITGITEKDFKQDAPRPKFGGLLSHKFLSKFSDFQFVTLDDFLQKVLSK